jgi:signal transduction histidine kinase
MWRQGLPLSLVSVWYVQVSQPLHWIINTAPLFLGLFAAFAGLRQDRLRMIYYTVLRQKMMLQETLQRAEASEELARNQQAELHQALEEVKAATALKAQFVSMVSHELRTPLTPILGYSDMLHQGLYGPLEPEQRDAVQRIVDNSYYLNQLITDLLDFAQLSSGKRVLRTESVALLDLLESVVRVFKEQAIAKNLAFRVQIEPTLPKMVLADRLIIQQILNNLLSNAIKFTTVGHVMLRVIVEPVQLHHNKLRLIIEVEDTGPGMTPCEQNLIFEPFRQVDTSLTRPRAGAGLGLTITQRLLELAAGSLRLESHPGQGSRFIVTLPIAVPQHHVEL